MTLVYSPTMVSSSSLQATSGSSLPMVQDKVNRGLLLLLKACRQRSLVAHESEMKQTSSDWKIVDFMKSKYFEYSESLYSSLHFYISCSSCSNTIGSFSDSSDADSLVGQTVKGHHVRSPWAAGHHRNLAALPEKVLKTERELDSKPGWQELTETERALKRASAAACFWAL